MRPLPMSGTCGTPGLSPLLPTKGLHHLGRYTRALPVPLRQSGEVAPSHLTPSERSAGEGNSGQIAVREHHRVQLRVVEIRLLHPASVEATDLQLREPERAQIQAAIRERDVLHAGSGK